MLTLGEGAGDLLWLSGSLFTLRGGENKSALFMPLMSVTEQ